jgi:hypothetical protein
MTSFMISHFSCVLFPQLLSWSSSDLPALTAEMARAREVASTLEAAHAAAEKASGQFLVLICEESLTCNCLNLNLGHFCSTTFIFVLFGELCLLVSWCAGGRCDLAGSNEDRGRSR